LIIAENPEKKGGNQARYGQNARQTGVLPQKGNQVEIKLIKFRRAGCQAKSRDWHAVCGDDGRRRKSSRDGTVTAKSATGAEFAMKTAGSEIKRVIRVTSKKPRLAGSLRWRRLPTQSSSNQGRLGIRPGVPASSRPPFLSKGFRSRSRPWIFVLVV
jgi:hypothetical protein